MQAGYNVRGVMYWTLVDNFEWAEGFAMKVGRWVVVWGARMI